MAEIRLANLTKHFGKVRAVEELNLVIPDGSFVAFLGPSGCGKTTTMNTISGLEKPTSGEVYFDDHAMSRVAPGKRNVGFVFQNYAIFTHMTVEQNLSFGLRVRKPRPSESAISREVHRVARIVGVDDILDRKARLLSVNDMQKVALGRSMILEPSIFLLDEPFSNLDAAFRAYMRVELKRIQQEIGQTMVYVTHDQVEAMSMADQIAVLHLGELQQYGTPDDLYNRPANRFVANFIGSVLTNFVPAVYKSENERAVVTLVGADSARIDVTDRKAAVESGLTGDRSLIVAVRPEKLALVSPDSDDARFRGKVVVVEPLGSKDIVHLSVEGSDLRVTLAPGTRPRVGDTVGIAFSGEDVHLFDTSTGLVLR